MADLKRDEVRDIGIAAIRRVIGDAFSDVSFKVEFDLDENPQYNFRIYLSSQAAWRKASAHMFEMTDAVMADLSIRDDDHFPFIWLLSDGSWDIGRDAAAE